MTIRPKFHTILSPEIAKKIGTVGILYGGLSDERQVSLWSGEAVYKALEDAGISAKLIDVQADFLSVIQKATIDWAFIVLHGRGGEDGTIQAILDWQGIPYVGSGVLASAIAIDKMRTKQLWQAEGLPVLPQILLTEGFDADEVIKKVGLPMAVKPALEGSSNGVSKVSTREELLPAFELANRHSSAIMAEKWVVGKEYTGAIIGDRAFPLIEIQIDSGLYDFNTKYVTGADQYHCPCGLAESEEKKLQSLIMKAAKTIGTKDWARVDLMVDKQNQPWLIEINTIPGMTETSLVPKATQAAGFSFTETVLTILKTSWEAQHARLC